MGGVNVKVSATSDQDLVQLSGYIVYRHRDDLSRVTFNGNRYKILNAEYDDPARHGLDAITVKDLQTGDVSIIYEGTQSEQSDLDLKTDIDLVK
ncbi:hypothetical protein ABNN70_06080 [Sporolactobacillus sp. Y61]|uniref:Uncharacterized protein n=1 Tax=Sporolactobacillus sp. Y61 TaxID=3160863 RepID=A0AAU8II76_9BACL